MLNSLTMNGNGNYEVSNSRISETLIMLNSIRFIIFAQEIHAH